MFNRRLSKSELDIWIDLLENQTDSECLIKELATEFLELPETLSFVSSVNNEVIGGTAIYRDRTRLGMILASIAVKKEFRDTGAYSIIKSSLPFFKTVAIRDVDALVPNESYENRLGFPGSFELDPWVKPILERMGFEEKEQLFSCSIAKLGDHSGNKDSLWDTQPDLENCKKLIWDTSKSTGMTNSVVWSTFDFAFSQGTLRTVTINDSTKLVTSIFTSGNAAIVGLLSSDDNFQEQGLATKYVTSMVKEADVEIVQFPLVGRGQIKLVEAVANELGGSLKSRSMTLMRRHL
ncbi:MAG: hypothetical protein RTV72_03940 [Candidatus Thorarchaeota archaeon]